MHITIAKPRLSDAPIMVKWGRESAALKDYSTDIWYSVSAIREWISDPNEDIILIARDGEKPVGMCLAHGMRNWAYCSTLYVDKAYRNKGIGTILLAKMIEHAKKRKYVEFALMVNKSNKEAKKFYRKQGFKKGYLFRWMGKKI